MFHAALTRVFSLAHGDEQSNLLEAKCHERSDTGTKTETIGVDEGVAVPFGEGGKIAPHFIIPTKLWC